MIEQATECLWVLGPISLVALSLVWNGWCCCGRGSRAMQWYGPSLLVPSPADAARRCITVVVATREPSESRMHSSRIRAGVRAATVLLAVVGMIGDVRTLPAAVRLAMQCVASAP
jgi:hypothetical protein